MTGLIIAIAVSLILMILVLVVRITQLTKVMKGEYKQRVGFANKVNAVLLPLSFVVGLIAFYFSYTHAEKYFLPEASSAHGVHTDALFWWTLVILMAAFIITNILLFGFPYFYQYKEGRKAYFYPDNHTVELVWTLLPAVTMAILVFFGWRLWSDIMDPSKEKGAEVIEVMAKQFGWQVRYPGADGKLGKHNYKLIDATNQFGLDLSDSGAYDDFIPTALYLPKGKAVTLHIRARDVLHSVFLPHFRVKMDAVPGMPTKFTFVPTKTTAEMKAETGNAKFNYELACTEICGFGHYGMKLPVIVLEQDEYNEWKKSQEAWVAQNADYVVKSNRGKKELLPVKNVPEEITTPADSNVAPADSVNKGATAMKKD